MDGWQLDVRSPLYEHAALSCVSDMIKCTGFADLFTGSEDLRLTAVVSDGGNGVALPDLDVRCMGQQCSLLSNVTFCQTSQDCAAGMTCEDYVFDTSYRYPLKLATMDVVGDVLWNGEHRLSAGCCSGSSSAAGSSAFIASFACGANAGAPGRAEAATLTPPRVTDNLGILTIFAVAIAAAAALVLRLQNEER